MKNSFTISVDKPCSADWSTFSTTSRGGFCPLCEKDVVDFTRMGEEELIAYFKNHNENTCGKFRKEQLRPYPVTRPSLLSRASWLSAGLLSLLICIGVPEVRAQDLNSPVLNSGMEVVIQQEFSDTWQTIRGVIRDEYGEPLPGTNVFLKGDPNTGVVADIEGRFEFPGELSPGDVLVFSFIGFETQEYTVTEDSPERLEIEMIMITDITGEIVVGGVYTSPSFFGRIWSGVKGLFN